MKVVQILVLLLAVFLFPGCSISASGESAGPPSYEVSRTTVPIRIDGVLDDPTWEATQSVGAFASSADGSDSSLETEAKIVYDDTFIYFAFRVWDDNIWSTFDTRDLDKSQPKMDCGTHVITGGTGKYKGITGSEPFSCIAMPALAGSGEYFAMDIPHNTSWEIK